MHDLYWGRGGRGQGRDHTQKIASCSSSLAVGGGKAGLTIHHLGYRSYFKVAGQEERRL